MKCPKRDSIRKHNLLHISICLLHMTVKLQSQVQVHTAFLSLFFFFFFGLFVFSRAAPSAYGGPQAKGQIGAVAVGLCQSHSSSGSEPRL